MTFFITLNSENRVVSYREGPYDPSDKSPNEIDVTDKNVKFGSIQYSIYDAETDSFIPDDYFLQKQAERSQTVPMFITPPKIVGLNYTEQEAAEAIQNKLDEKAKEYQYDNIFTASTYFNSTNPKFKGDAEAFIKWRDDVWVWAYDIQDKVRKEEIEKPTLEELLNQMPTFVPSSYVEGSLPV